MALLDSYIYKSEDPQKLNTALNKNHLSQRLPSQFISTHHTIRPWQYLLTLCILLQYISKWLRNPPSSSTVIISDYQFNSKTYSLIVAINYYFYGGSMCEFNYSIIRHSTKPPIIINGKEEQKRERKMERHWQRR